ncbi:hypothetical protein ACFCT7_08915 [Fulvivirgaceae bacterium LMO-SS25]
MAKKIKEDQLNELYYLKEWCSSVVKFILEQSPVGGDMLMQYDIVINSSYQKQDIRGLRMVAKDVMEWAKGLSESDKSKLDEVLESKFGSGLNGEIEKKNVAQILKRGKITTEDEYRLLLNRIEEIHTDPSKNEEVERVNLLLGEYHKKQK